MGAHEHPTVVPTNADERDTDEENGDDNRAFTPNYGVLRQ